MNATEFKDLIGDDPERDDLDRVNCPDAGKIGHSQCGICSKCGYPRFIPKVDGDNVCHHLEDIGAHND